MGRANAPLRVVLDTNVVLSALLFTRGSLAPFRRLWQTGRLVPVVSKDTASELLRVLGYPKFKLSSAEREQLLADYLPHAETITLTAGAAALAHVQICRDPDDQKFLDLAHIAKVDFLVTGDDDLLTLNDPASRHLAFQIRSPADFLLALGS